MRTHVIQLGSVQVQRPHPLGGGGGGGGGGAPPIITQHVIPRLCVTWGMFIAPSAPVGRGVR